jgi:5-methylcytosine-specific restriction endonuclease McrA
MKTCPKCKSEHSKNGAYCSRPCANSRTFSASSIAKKSKANKKFYKNLSEKERLQYAEDKRTKFDYEDMQKRAKETKVQQSWTRPYEEMGRDSLRKRLIHERNYTCEHCGLTGLWNGKPLTLEMDHIDGNNKNNDVKNLQILCPNCHSQTHTFRGKNNKNNKRIDVKLLTKALIKFKYASPALKELGFSNSAKWINTANVILEDLRSKKII